MGVREELQEIQASFDALDCYMKGEEGEERLRQELMTDHAVTLSKIDVHITVLTFWSESSGSYTMREMLKQAVKCFNKRLKRVMKGLL